MARLILGPSRVGKSSYIENMIDKKEISNEDIIFGYQIKIKKFNFFGLRNSIKKKSVVHYNILNSLIEDKSNEFISDKIFSEILKNKKIFKEVIVLVAPINELISRSKSSIYTEKKDKIKYDNDFWLNTYNEINLFKIYENLFEVLDSEKIEYKVVYSSNNLFKLSDRVFVHHNLNGKYFEPPLEKKIYELKNKREMHYQSVILPYNIKSSTKEFKHIPSNRDDSFKPLSSQDLRNKSILDIGSAIGNYLFKSERYGATKLYGVEKNKDRYLASTSVAEILNSKAKFINSDFNKDLFNEEFDYVLCLNVIHHIEDYEKFLSDAANLTKKMLLLEFPTFLDPKFMSYKKMNKREAIKMNDLSKLGESSKEIDQTYVYSPGFIKKFFMNKNFGFLSYNNFNSPIEGRIIMSFLK